MFAQAFKMDASALLSAFSPSKTCKVRVSSTRYRNDPYRARVGPHMKPCTPVFTGKKFFAAPAAIVPIQQQVASPVSLAPIPQAPAPAVAPKPFVVKAAEAPKHDTPIAASPAPQPSEPASKKDHFAVVGFKHEVGTYQAPFRVAIGDVVVVQADRGEHIGVVQSISTVKPKFNVPCRIVRRASAAEARHRVELHERERSVSQSVQKLAESFGLGIRNVDVEFQADNNKLTVFFASKCFVDFRKLQRSLFRDYRCRIWLTNWNEVRAYTPVPVNPIAE